VVQFFGTPTYELVGLEKEVGLSWGSLEAMTKQARSTNSVAGEAKTKPLISPLSLTRYLSAFLFGLITGALIIDAYVLMKKKVYRSVGRTTAHAGFLALIFLLILLSQPGVIN